MVPIGRRALQLGVGDDVGAGGRDEAPVVTRHEIGADLLVEMAGRRGQAEHEVEVVGADVRQRDGEGVVVVAGDAGVVFADAVPVVVPRVLDVRALVEPEQEEKVVGRDRRAVAPAGGGVDAHVDGFRRQIGGPMGGDAGEVAMRAGDVRVEDAKVDHVVVEEVAAKTARRVMADDAESAGKILEPALPGAAANAVGGAELGELAAVGPDEIGGEIGGGFENEKLGVRGVVGLHLGGVVGSLGGGGGVVLGARAGGEQKRKSQKKQTTKRLGNERHKGRRHDREGVCNLGFRN